MKSDEKYISARRYMLEEQIIARGISDNSVLRAMATVPRHKFVSNAAPAQAYGDYPLDIDCGQTISQPYIVALMTQLLGIERNDKVLEIGTGSGYQTAVLAEISDKVFSLEYYKELSERAKVRLSELGYKNISILNSGNFESFKDESPFDKIIVTCAPEHIPYELLDQLASEGSMVIPAGPAGSLQYLYKIVKKNEKITTDKILAVRFVPMLS